MTSNATLCSTWRLYVIVDPSASKGRPLSDVAAAAIRGGADVIQLRDKQATARELLQAAERLLAVTKAAGIPLIVNDRADVALAAGADGVHLGQDDLPVAAARRILGPGRLIGKSTHSLAQAEAAAREPVDYIGFGPLFATPTKPEYPPIGPELIASMRAAVSLPHVCIGGIDGRTIARAVVSGARCVAVVRAVCGADDPEAAAAALKRTMDSISREPGSIQY